jgi:hypothetical protein
MKIDKFVNDLFKHLEDSGFNELNSSNINNRFFNNNWDMINAIIAENEGNEWFIPKDDVVNAWTSAISLTVGNIARDFELESLQIRDTNKLKSTMQSREQL